VPPPVRREVFTLYEEEDSLSEASRASNLKRGIAYRDDLSIHDGLFNRAPRIIVARSNGGIKQERRHCGGRKYLWKLEEEERETESQKAQEQERKQEDNEQ